MRRGAASVEPPCPRPAAPRLTSPRGPGGAGPRSRVPLQTAAARPELRPPRPAAAGSEVTGSTNETLRAGGPDWGRPARSLEGLFGGLCSREQGACADARGRSGPEAERAWQGRGGAWGGGGDRGGAEGVQKWDQRFPLPGSLDWREARGGGQWGGA